MYSHKRRTDKLDQRTHNKVTDKQGKVARDTWMIDKKIPLALLLAIVVQTVVLVSWIVSFKATTENRLTTIEKQQSTYGDSKVIERLVRMETLLEGQKEILNRIETRQAHRDSDKNGKR